MQELKEEIDDSDLINIKTFCFSNFTLKNVKAKIKSIWKISGKTHIVLASLDLDKVWFVCFSACLLLTWHKLWLSGKRKLQQRNTSIELAYRQVCGGMFLINDWWERAQPTMGTLERFFWTVQKSKLSKPVNSYVLPWFCFSPTSKFLHWVSILIPFMQECASWNKPFLGFDG